MLHGNIPAATQRGTEPYIYLQEPMDMKQSRSSICRLLLIVLLILTGACSDNSSDNAKSASMEDKIHLLLEDGPHTDEARAQIALLTDSIEGNDREAYRTIRRIGRDAAPALVEALYEPYNETIKQNALWYLGELGVAAAPAVPFLDDIQIKGPTWVSYAAKQALHKIEQAKTCGLPELPEDVKIHVVGRYKGEKELDVQLGDSGHTVTEIEVVVDRTDYPVALVLSAYDPVVWRVGTTPRSKLVAVLVSGYHTQALLGIKKTLPHKVISGEQSLGCDAFHASGIEDAATIERDILSMTGHGIHKFHGASPNDFFRIGGDPHLVPSSVSFFSDLTLDDYNVYKGEIPAGPRGVDELERLGKIRAATRQDIDAWMNGAREHNPDMLARIYPGTAYVVLESITLPPGLFGGHARLFIIPEDVPKPDGPKGHCQFYYMKDFTRE
jgi:hypothetical protein